MNKDLESKSNNCENNSQNYTGSSDNLRQDDVNTTPTEGVPDINDGESKSVNRDFADRLERSKEGTPTYNDVTFKKDKGRTNQPLSGNHEPGTLPGGSF